MGFGNCRNCKFSLSFREKYGDNFKHWSEEHGYKYFCQRFPPGAVTSQAPFDNKVLVKPEDGCYEYKPLGEQ